VAEPWWGRALVPPHRRPGLPDQRASGRLSTMARAARRRSGRRLLPRCYSLLMRGLDRVLPGGRRRGPGAVAGPWLIGAAAIVVRLGGGRRKGRRAATIADRGRRLLFAFFPPAAFVLSMVYAEGPAGACSRPGCLLAPAPAALASWPGVLGGPWAGRHPAQRHGPGDGWACRLGRAGGPRFWRDREVARRRWWPPLLAPVGMLAFFGFLWWHTGEAAHLVPRRVTGLGRADRLRPQQTSACSPISSPAPPAQPQPCPPGHQQLVTAVVFMGHPGCGPSSRPSSTSLP